jgi:hypothetical protein
MEENEQVKQKATYWKYENITYILGKWAWVFAILAGIIDLLFGIVGAITVYQSWAIYLAPLGIPITETISSNAYNIWNIISSILLIIFAFFIIKPRFSDKCAQKDWDYLLNDVLQIGSFRFPWMFIWAIIAEILGQWWGGSLIIIPAILLVFLGPKEYNWKK